jgi:hypothetical protein
LQLRRLVVLVLVTACNAGLFLGLGAGPVTLIATRTAAELERTAQALADAGS